MYNLYKLDEDLYQIHSSFYGEKAMEGTLVAIVTYMVTNLLFTVDEIECAVMAMHHEDMDAAHFGVNRTFIYPFNRNPKKVG